jgi:phenylpropionate dioxygenase-like ring-hydroxylating dioxygenase large terminal subunit
VDALVERLTRDWWHLVAHRSEVAQAGDWVRLDWPLGELVVFNDQGTVIAFDNLCPHRGARFFVENAGNGRIACPYHGWSFRGGELRIPLRQTFDPAEVAGAGLNSYRTAWCGDFLFVGVAPTRALEEQLAEAAEPLAAVSRQIARRADFNAFAWSSDWRVAVENALETYHVGGVHPDSLGRLGLIEERTEHPGEGSIYFGQVGEERVRKGLERMRRFFDIDHAYDGYWSIHLFPFAMISSTFGYSYSLQLFSPAREPGRTAFSSRLLTARVKPGSEAALDSFFASTAQVNRQVFEEDHAICARVSPLYDLEKPGRYFASSEDRVRRLHATLQAIRPAG